ncbi:BamA/TamA family outer membrane protein [Algoriphagus sp. PAP.12]|uniref:BamA/TamA family outer membrane protein n=1 Tax=Algoriphagus sp. PAP.12 TaxID=2996678 RepID=UPI00227C57EB|nr:BamA/TamA family outer membrane protein [Algoriphagus sp. PAP.12]
MRQLYFLLFLFTFLSLKSLAQEQWLGWRVGEESRLWKNYSSDEKRVIGLDSIVNHYKIEGYLAAFSREEKRNSDSLWISIDLGPAIEKVNLSSGNLPTNLVKNINWGEKTFVEVSLLIDQILQDSENDGYPFASVKLDSISRTGSGIEASLNYDYGPLITWDSVKVNDQSKTSEKYIQNLLGIVPGSPFSEKQLSEAVKVIDRSPYFKSSGYPALTFQFQKAQPTFQLIERNANVIDGIIGFLPNENEPGKLLVTGQLDLQLYHLGGKGRDVLVSWQRFNELTQSLAINAKESFIFNSPLDVGGAFSLLKQDSTFLKRDLGIVFGYRVSPNFYVNFLANRVASDLLATFEYREVDELPEIADYRWSEYGVAAEWDLLDDIIAPRRGFKVRIKTSAGNKRILENTGLPEEVYTGLDMNTPQYSFQLNLEKHVFIKPNWGMYLGGAGGLVQNENLLLNDLYRIGGLKSIRGFNENFFYASSYAYLNFEQRLFFGENSFLLLFLDGGILENPYFAMSKEKPFSMGAGLNFETGSGIFRFIYAVGKSNQQALTFSQSNIHFGYLARF